MIYHFSTEPVSTEVTTPAVNLWYTTVEVTSIHSIISPPAIHYSTSETSHQHLPQFSKLDSDNRYVEH